MPQARDFVPEPNGGEPPENGRRLPDDSPPGDDMPCFGNPVRKDAAGWLIMRDLTKELAEQLLDWLEAHEHHQRSSQFQADGRVTVRWKWEKAS